MRPTVLKFGGTSLGTPERLRAAIGLARPAATDAPRVVVVSAFAGVTNQLIALVEGARRREAGSAVIADPAHGPGFRALLAEIAARHRAALVAVAGPAARAARARIDAELERLAESLAGVELLRECPAAARDAIVATGERLSAPIFAAGLAAAGRRARFLDAADLIVTDDAFGEATVDLAATAARAGAALADLAQGEVAVVPGFYGAGPDGALRLLGRGASDYTATLLGAALDAERVEIWTDVDGVLSADPALVPEAYPLPRLTFDEAAELAYFGAKVLHQRAVAPVAARNIPLTVRNSFRPEAPGTTVDARRASVCGLAAQRGVALLEIVGGGSAASWDLAARAAGALGRARVPVWLLQQASARPALTVALPCREVARAEAALAAELADASLRCTARNGLALLAVVGEALGDRRREAAHRAFERERIVPQLFHESAGAASLVTLLAESDLPRAARRLHAEIALGAAERSRAIALDADEHGRSVVLGAAEHGEVLALAARQSA